MVTLVVSIRASLSGPADRDLAALDGPLGAAPGRAADLAKELRIPHAQLVIRKGYRQHVDSYSAFLEADRKAMTGLTGYLKERGLERVFLVGLATDYCVKETALDALRQGFGATVDSTAVRAIDAQPGDGERALAQVREAGGSIA